jgi:hypothetical protein
MSGTPPRSAAACRYVWEYLHPTKLPLATYDSCATTLRQRSKVKTIAIAIRIAGTVKRNCQAELAYGVRTMHNTVDMTVMEATR